MYSQDKKSKAKQCNINKTYLKKKTESKEKFYMWAVPLKKLSRVQYLIILKIKLEIGTVVVIHLFCYNVRLGYTRNCIAPYG